jgi:hypothetical protein
MSSDDCIELQILKKSRLQLLSLPTGFYYLHSLFNLIQIDMVIPQSDITIRQSALESPIEHTCCAFMLYQMMNRLCEQIIVN